MGKLLAQLKRIADAQETQCRLTQEWMQFNQEIDARHQQYRKEDLARIQDQQTEEEIRYLTIENLRKQESEVAQKAMQERIAALTPDEIKEIAERVFTQVFPSEQITPASKFTEEDLRFLHKELSYRFSKSAMYSTRNMQNG